MPIPCVFASQLESTRNLVTAKEIGWMPQGSYLINAARGDVVKVDDFAEALKSVRGMKRGEAG